MTQNKQRRLREVQDGPENRTQGLALDWIALRARPVAGVALVRHELSKVETSLGAFTLLEDAMGDSPEACRRAIALLSAYRTYPELLADIAPH